MLDFGLESVHELPVLGEHSHVEVVVVVRHQDLAPLVHADPNGIVCQALSTDLPQEHPVVVEHLDAVRPVVRDEDLLSVVDYHAVGELEVLGAAKLLQHIATLVEDDDPHHLALDHDNAALRVHCNAARVLQNYGTKLAYRLRLSASP